MNKRADQLMTQAIKALKTARPANGRYPVTEQECTRTMQARRLLGKAIFVAGGMPEGKADALARFLNEGPIGRQMLDMSVELEKKLEREETTFGNGRDNV